MAIFDPEKGRLRIDEVFSFLLNPQFRMQKIKYRASKWPFSDQYDSNDRKLLWPDPINTGLHPDPHKQPISIAIGYVSAFSPALDLDASSIC